MKRLYILKNKEGFTLIELIVVIVIIAILAAIAIPNMIGFRKQARITAAESNARTAYSAIMTAFAMTTNTDKLYASTVAVTNAKNITDLKGTGVILDPAEAEPFFEQKIAELLGDGFPGFISWTLIDGNITAVRWYDSNAASLDVSTPYAEFDINTQSFVTNGF